MIKLIKSKKYWIATATYVILAIGSFSICGSIHGWAPFGGSPACIPLDIFYAPIYYAFGLSAAIGDSADSRWFIPIAAGAMTLAVLVSGFITQYLIRGAIFLKRTFDEWVRVKPQP
jgi:hypothetical protein